MKIKNTIWEIIKWIFIFVIGSLIVSFIIYPETAQIVYENIESIIPDIKEPAINTERVIPSDQERFGLLASYNTKCSGVEASGRANGVINLKKKVCQETCGKINKSYNSKDCENDLLICYCE